MRRLKQILSTVVLLALTVGNLSAQFTNEGQNPFSVRWLQINSPNYRIVYPENYGKFAQSTAALIDTAASSIAFGYTRPGQRLPLVMNTLNLKSNGLVVWAPKRAELIMTPPTNTFASPWFKQLVVHEYRHVVQMSNLDRRFIRTLSYVGGEQIVGLSAALLPVWFLEGDAVLAETALTSYGRALQPEFTIEYRAYMENSSLSRFAIDKWFCGSFKDFIPNHYQLGYQITNWSYRNMGGDFWEKMTDISAKYPYLLIPRGLSFRRDYHITVEHMLRKSFDELKQLWDPALEVENSAEVLDTPKTSYTLYSYPVEVDDTTIVALKYDLDFYTRFVAINTRTAAEKHIRYTGQVSSRPIYRRGEMLWTEYRPSTFWEQKNISVICRMSLDGSQKVYRNRGNIFYVTPYREGFAAIEYDTQGYYYVVYFDDGFKRTHKTPIPDSLTVHGMAWDEQTNTLALITLCEDGMALSKVEGDSIVGLTAPSYVSINNLNSGGGKLVFNSIYSGKDEIHIYDIASGKEYRQTTSRFGSIMPSIRDEKVSQVTYFVDGYFVSTQATDTLTEVVPAAMPLNLLNAPVATWDAITVNVDTLKIYANTDPKPTRRYRKAAHALNIHSWLPLQYNPFELVDDRNLEISLGATVISQNALSTTSGFLSYGVVNGNSIVKGALHYLGFAPKIELYGEYGGGGRDSYSIENFASGETRFSFNTITDRQFATFKARVFLPINLSGGYNLRYLTPSAELITNNARIFYSTPDHNREYDGYRRVETSLSYVENVRLSYRDFAPRWGYSTKVSYTRAIANPLFGSLYSVLAGIYTPGIMPIHSLRLSGAIQRQQTRLLNFRSNVLFPRGCEFNINPERLEAATASYKFPLWYPDGGITNFIYFKRVIAGFFGGYARYKQYGAFGEAYSYGAEAIINTNPVRIINGSMDFDIAVFKTNSSGRPNVSFGISFGL